MFARAIADARQVSGLSQAQFAALLELDAATIRDWEAGTKAVAPGHADAVARLFGLDLSELLRTDLREMPSALLFRSMAESGAVDRFAADRLPHQLGDFLRCVRVVSECERLAGEAPPLAWLDRLEPAPLVAGSRPPHGAEELAARVRVVLGLGDAPIASMRELLESLGVAVFFADPDTLHPAVDAACTLHPRPAILVNVTAGGEKWWRTRMSLAHELAHLCFDRDVLGAPRRLFLFSPAEKADKAGRAGAWRLVDRFEALEQRASAFAAYFLAPRAAVTSLVPRSQAGSPAAAATLMRHFGLGLETAANVLMNVFGLSNEQRFELIGRRGVELPEAHPDRVMRPRLRDDRFIGRVLRCYRDGSIDGIRARRWLLHEAHELLPAGFGLSDEQRAPIVSQGDRVRQRVDALLRSVLDDHALYVAAVEELGEAAERGALRARVVRWLGDERAEPVGEVVVGEDLRVLRAIGPGLGMLVQG